MEAWVGISTQIMVIGLHGTGSIVTKTRKSSTLFSAGCEKRTYLPALFPRGTAGDICSILAGTILCICAEAILTAGKNLTVNAEAMARELLRLTMLCKLCFCHSMCCVDDAVSAQSPEDIED
jgi:hypothetical protein